MKAGTKTAALYDDMVGSMNPIEMVDDLATGMTSIVATGRTKKTSEGVRVWEYEVTLATAERVDLAMEAAEGGPAVRAQLESLADELGPEIAATYWIGRNALLYEATVQMGPIGSSVVYESWGGEVGVVAPPPGDVEEVDSEAFEAALG
jgi:hypothetical protein